MQKMTLSKQLILTGCIILLCLFTGILTFVVINTQSFLNNQLGSHSQDTATALGLTLTTTMKNNDAVTARRIVDAVWDRGYYESIMIEDMNGQLIVNRHEPIRVYSVPQWFINFLPLSNNPKEALIMDGWQKIGKVKIQSNPGFAYRQIWSTFVDSSLWLLITALIALMLGSILLFIILKPLRAITHQAMEICNQQFSIQKTLPWTIDLRMVVEAMNSMTLRIKRMFEEQAQISEALRQQVYKDPISGLGNRRYFDMQLDYVLQEKQYNGGSLLLIELNDFKTYNEKFGYPKGDELIKNTAKAISNHVPEGAIGTHLQGASFAVILPHKPKELAEHLANQIVEAFAQFKLKGFSESENVGHIGVVLYNDNNTKTEILSKADMALRQAQAQGANKYYYLETNEEAQIHGAQEWGTIFDNALNQNNVVLHFQEISLFDQPNKYYETLMRIRHENELIPAGVFLPMAQRTHYMAKLDQALIEVLIQKILHSSAMHSYFVNLSPAFIDDLTLQTWLFEKISMLGKKARQLIIEFPEYIVINRVASVKTFFIKFASLGGQLSIDHYGKSFSAFSYLFNLKLNYLKIDGSYIKQIDTHEENQFFVRKLVDIAHSLGISVIAEAVETQREYQTLIDLKLDGVQGFYVGKPKEISD